MNNIVFDGNSMTLGTGIDFPASQSYPAQALALLGSGWGGTNRGVSGQTTGEMDTTRAAGTDALFDAGATSNHLIAWEIGNELYGGAGSISAATALADFVAYCAHRRAAGFTVHVVTLTPWSSAGTYAGFEADRQTVNTYFRAHWAEFADGLVDIAAITGIGVIGDETNTLYFADLVHMTQSGYALVAGAVVAHLLAGTVTTLRQGALPTSAFAGCQDAQVTNGAYADDNWGGGPYVCAGVDGGVTFRGLLRFDLSSIPTGSVVNGAVLTLACTLWVGTDATVDLYDVSAANGDWVEGTLTSAIESGSACWNAKAYGGANWAGSVGLGTSGTDYATNAIGTATRAGAGPTGTVVIQLNAYGLAALARDAGNASPRGFLLASRGEPSATLVGNSSRSSTPVVDRPMLAVSWAAPGGTTAATPTLVSRTATSITVAWAGAAGGTSPYTYAAYKGGVLAASNVTSPYTFTGLLANHQYDLTIQATDSLAATDTSDPLTTHPVSTITWAGTTSNTATAENWYGGVCPLSGDSIVATSAGAAQFGGWADPITFAAAAITGAATFNLTNVTATSVTVAGGAIVTGATSIGTLTNLDANNSGGNSGMDSGTVAAAVNCNIRGGTITGSVSIGLAATTFDNSQANLVLSGATVRLSADATLENKAGHTLTVDASTEIDLMTAVAICRQKGTFATAIKVVSKVQGGGGGGIIVL